MSLNTNSRSQLRQFLVDHFGLEELKDIAFDIGVDFELFSYSGRPSFCRELVIYLERRDKLSCLVTEILKYRYDSRLAELVSELTPCKDGEKVQVILPKDKLVNVSNNMEKLAEILQVDKKNIALIAVTSGSMRLLLGLPQGAVNFQALLESRYPSYGEYPVTSLVLFSMLSEERQLVWRIVARNNPPLLEGNTLRPTISWQHALEATRSLEAGAAREVRDYRSARGFSSEDSIISGAEAQAERSVYVHPPISNLGADPDQPDTPVPAHKKVHDHYVWYEVSTEDENFLREVVQGSWVLVNTDTAHHNFKQDELIVVLRSENTDGSIVLKPRTPGLPFQGITFLGSLQFEDRFVRDVTRGKVALSPYTEQPLHRAEILGIVVGLWLPLSR